MDKIELAGIIFELLGLEDFDAEIVISPDGKYEILSDKKLTYLPSKAFVYLVTGKLYDQSSDVIDYCFNQMTRDFYVINHILSLISDIELSGEKELKIIPISSFEKYRA